MSVAEHIERTCLCLCWRQAGGSRCRSKADTIVSASPLCTNLLLKPTHQVKTCKKGYMRPKPDRLVLSWACRSLWPTWSILLLALYCFGAVRHLLRRWLFIQVYGVYCIKPAGDMRQRRGQTVPGTLRTAGTGGAYRNTDQLKQSFRSSRATGSPGAPGRGAVALKRHIAVLNQLGLV